MLQEWVRGFRSGQGIAGMDKKLQKWTRSCKSGQGVAGVEVILYCTKLTESADTDLIQCI